MDIMVTRVDKPITQVGLHKVWLCPGEDILCYSVILNLILNLRLMLMGDHGASKR